MQQSLIPASLKGLSRLATFLVELPWTLATLRLASAQLLRWRPDMLPDALTSGLAASLLRERLGAISRDAPVTHVLAASHAAVGGGEYIAACMCTALLQLRPDAMILLVTHGPDRVPAWSGLPAGVRHVGLTDFAPTWSAEDFHLGQLQVLMQCLKPESLHVINHVLAWQLIRQSGAGLRASGTRIYASVFAREYYQGSFQPGFTRDALAALPWLDALLSDNQCVLDEISQAAGQHVPAYCLPSPCRLSLDDLSVQTDNLQLPPSARGHFIWAGRLSPEKRPELFLALARSHPEHDFTMHGSSVQADPESATLPDNLVRAGRFESPLAWMSRGRVTALVFTSHWEGLPNVLLEAGMLGIPVIAPQVGGVAELINAETGYLLPAAASEADYQGAMADIIRDPEQAIARATRLRERVARRHAPASFRQALAAVPGYVGQATLKPTIGMA